ncbi:hypothetical protein ACHWQZ_G015450 [Mnemiopsis leidyi]
MLRDAGLVSSSLVHSRSGDFASCDSPRTSKKSSPRIQGSKDSSPGVYSPGCTYAGGKKTSNVESEVDKKPKVKINVGGEVYVTYISTLERFPDTLLGNEKVGEILVFGLLISTSSTAIKDKYFNSQQSIRYVGFWGNWGSWEDCDGSYAVSFSQKVEANQGSGDDSAVNGVCLQCSDGKNVCSTVGPWGTWASSSECPAGFSAADIKVEPKQGEGDDSATNGLKLFCSSGGSHVTPNMGPWGTWWGRKSCNEGQRICGIKTQMEPILGDGDDSALNGIELRCCSKILSVFVRLVQIFSRPGNGVPDPEGSKYLKQVESVKGIVHNSGGYLPTVISDIAHQVQESADFTEAADTIVDDIDTRDVQQTSLGVLVGEALSAGLDYTLAETPVILSVPVNVYQDVHAYVGEKREKFYDSESEMLVFNRNRVLFEWILFYYQSNGDLYIPKTMPVDLIERELTFFGILKGDGTTSPQNTEKHVTKETADCEEKSLREKLYKVVSVPYSSVLSTVWALLDVFLILVSIIAFTIETEPSFVQLMEEVSNVANILFYIDAVCVSFFSTDLLVKFVTWPNRIDFFKDLLNWCDMIAVGPFYIQLITFMFNGDVHLPTLFILRMGRVVRLFKLVRRIPALTMVINIIVSSRRELAMLAVLWCIFVYISAALMFFLENLNQDSKMFETMFHSLWWSVVTMGTVGYGDIYPKEAVGKVAGVFVVFGSTIFLTLPMTVIVSKFNDVYDDIKEQKELNNRDFTKMSLREKIVLVQSRQ